MFRNIVLATLLISSVCALHYEMHKGLTGDEHEESSGESMEETEELPGVCWACKWAMRKLKKHISTGTNANDIKKQLSDVCDEIGFLKSLCKNLVHKYTDMLVEELSTTDDASTICVNIGVC
ncbi:antimicrobial peptide NK-lysin-like isoform X2 [Xyrauchen texanus]|uniref:antimicrobial peptide NK-lysin-like isoform X1 n=1 Tax=Xyrauchen texanus TaxID=154827 RepID=UPI002241C19A|nr:antimicrobial peptide NK-lysin-like isoform X1 [Xyrauchen texanus]XP_052009719.1 antimicrobial peptide NK-lysin-like isoform X2 [Xyrauchen texanus]